MNPIRIDTNICRYLPDWYKPVGEYQELCNIGTTCLEELAEAIHAVKENFFFTTMTEGGIEEWEAVFGIVPNPATEDIEFRRARVLNRISTKPPFTLGLLYQKLDELIGPGLWTVTVDYPNYTLYIEAAAQDVNWAGEISYTINMIKPAHIVYTNRPFVRSGLLLSESISHALRTYNYKLGSWALGALPFATDTDLGVIKLPETPSVQAQLLNDTANFVLGDIASAQLNGSIAVASINKSQSGSTVTVEYTVTEAMTTEITAVALLDSEGNALTSANIYVPVSGQVVMKHVIPVAEGVVNDGG